MEDAAFRKIVDRHWRSCFATGYRLTRDAAAAEDLAQEAFLRLYRRRNFLSDEVKFGAYLCKTVVRLVIDRARKVARRKEVALPQEETAAPAGEPETGFTEAVREAVLDLPRREGEVFTLRVLEDLSTREAAESLGLAEGAVRRYLYDAIRRLRRSLGGWADEETR